MLAIRNRNDIDFKQVLRNIGYRHNAEPSARVASLLDDYIENAHQLIEPSYAYVMRDIISVRGDRVVIEGGVVFESEIIARLLRRCDNVFVFVATIGGYLEETVRWLSNDGRMVQASVLDAIGSGAVEKVVGFIHDRIDRIARIKGYCISRRFSPGYCDWDISQQTMVFKAMNKDTASVRLTDSCLMLPRKSVSGVIGIGSGNAVADYNPCRDCNKRDCSGRR